MSNYYLNSFDSTPLFVHAWDEVTAPRGLVLVCHDVGTHGGRYEPMANALNQAGYIVIAYDQRGFGATSRPGKLGHGNRTTFEYSVQDVIFLFRFFLRKYDLPIFLLGQGYGAYLIVSALERGIITPKGVLLLSCAKLSRQTLFAVQSVAKTLPMREKATTLGLPLLQPLLQKEDAQSTAAYADPLDHVIPTVQFDLSLIEGLLSLSKPDQLALLDRKIPYALFEGMQDVALGKNAQNAIELLLFMRRLGFDPRFFGYEDAAHDLLSHPLSPRYFEHILSFIRACA